MDVLFQNHTQYDKSAAWAAVWVISRTTRKAAFRLRRVLFLLLGLFALMLDKRHSLIVDQSGFSSGTPQAFRAFFQGRTGKEIPVL